MARTSTGFARNNASLVYDGLIIILSYQALLAGQLIIFVFLLTMILENQVQLNLLSIVYSSSAITSTEVSAR